MTGPTMNRRCVTICAATLSAGSASIGCATSAGTTAGYFDHGATVRGADGKAVRLVGAIRDITAEKHAEEALRRSEERFKGYAGIASDWFWEMGPDLRYTFVSERHQEITGAERSAVLGRTPSVDPEGYFAALRAHEPFEFEYEWLHPNGTSRFLRNAGEPVFDANDVFQGYRGIGRDVTETCRADQLLQAVIDVVPAMISAKNMQSRYLLMNRYRAELYGVTTEEAIGKTAAELVGAEYGKHTQRLDQQVFSCGEPIPTYEEPFVDAQGREYTFLTTKVPLCTLEGEPNWVATVSLDISERVRTERVLQEQSEFQRLQQTITAAANEAVRLEDAMQIVLDEICAKTGWPFGHVYLYDEAVEVLRPTGLIRWHNKGLPPRTGTNAYIPRISSPTGPRLSSTSRDAVDTWNVSIGCRTEPASTCGYSIAAWGCATTTIALPA